MPVCSEMGHFGFQIIQGYFELGLCMDSKVIGQLPGQFRVED